MQATKLNNLTAKEYIDIEISMDTRYEYHDGFIHAMAGGTLPHGLICGNIFGEIRTVLRAKGSSCRPINNDVKLHIPSKNKYLYPDTMVICGEIEASETEIDAVTNPTVVVEVLSKSTASYDRGDKFYFYRQIPTLQEYILIEQEKALVEIYKRENDLWKITRFEGLDSEIYISSLDILIKMNEIYNDVNL